MDHRQPCAGYHTRTTLLGRRPVRGARLAILAALSQLACLLPPLEPLGPPQDAPAPPFQSERRALVAGINAARAEVGARPLAYDALLQRVGDLHCERLIADGVWGHFALDAVPPYARYLLAGGHGYHRENAASYSSSIGVAPDQIGGILHDGLVRMLAERPPDDGHRRTLLDPLATHIGIGLAIDGGEVRVSDEVAVELATAWNGAPPVARPQTRLTVAGRLAEPWEAVAVEVLWEPVPHRLEPRAARARGAYAYPPRRSIAYASVALEGRSAGGEGGRLEVRGRGAFAFAWTTGPEPGIEVVVVWAHRSPRERKLSAVAASCTVITRDGVLPPEYARWAALGAPVSGLPLTGGGDHALPGRVRSGSRAATSR